MKVRLAGNDLCSYIVSSESESDKEYEVDICLYPVGRDEDGDMLFNGACVCTRTDNQWVEWGCEDWRFRCEPRIKKHRPEDGIKFYRCKHIDEARTYALKIITPKLAESRQNTPDGEQP